MYLEEIKYKSSRIKILTDKSELIATAYKELIKQRNLIEDYIKKDIVFEASLEPIEVKNFAPEIVKEMAYSGKIASVGPMAAVAGEIAERISKFMISKGAKVAIIENGGDIFAITDRKIRIGLFSGNNKLSGKIAFELDEKNTPLSICSSSSFLGHSLSFGKCDLGTVFSKKGAIADACVTALCNRVKKEEDIDAALKWVIELKGVLGAIVIKNDKIGMIGEIPGIIRSEDNKIKEKVTKDEIWKF